MLVLRGDAERGMVDWALSLALALYVGGLMQFYLPLRRLPDGGLWVVSLLVLSWVCDSCAFFVGRAFGRRRLAPRDQPEQVGRGGRGGPGRRRRWSAPPSGWCSAAALALMAGYGLAIGVATVVGDLAESGLEATDRCQRLGRLDPRPWRHPRPHGQPAVLRTDRLRLRAARFG